MSDSKPKPDGPPGSSAGWLYGVGNACIVSSALFAKDSVTALHTHTDFYLPGPSPQSIGPIQGFAIAIGMFVVGVFGVWAGHDKAKEKRARDAE